MKWFIISEYKDHAAYDEMPCSTREEALKCAREEWQKVPVYERINLEDFYAVCLDDESDPVDLIYFNEFGEGLGEAADDFAGGKGEIPLF